MVDVVGELRIQVAQRIVRQRGQMYHGIKAREVRCRQIAKILAELGNVRTGDAEIQSA